MNVPQRTAIVTEGCGRIVNLSSISALGNRGQANYAAAKADQLGMPCQELKALSAKEILPSLASVSPSTSPTPVSFFAGEVARPITAGRG